MGTENDVSFRIRAEDASGPAVDSAIAKMGQLAAAEQAAAKGAAASAKETAKMTAAATSLRFQLIDIGQGLAMGQSPLLILAQQGGQVGQALMQASASGESAGAAFRAALGPLAAVLPVAAVAAAGLAMAYQGLTAQTEQAAAVSAAFGGTVKGVTAMMDDARVAAKELARVTAGNALAEVEAGQRLDATIAKYREATAATRELIAANNEILGRDPIPDSWEEAIGKVSRGFGDLAEDIDSVDGGIDGLSVRTGLFSFITTAMDGVSTSTKELREQTYAAIGADLQARGAAIIAAAAEDKLAAAKRNVAAASGEKRRAVQKEPTEQEKRNEQARSAQKEANAMLDLTEKFIAVAAAEMDAEWFPLPPLGAYQELANTLDGLFPPETLSAAEQLAKFADEARESFALGKLTLEQYESLQGAIDKRGEQVAADEAKAAAEAAAEETVGGVGQALSNPLQAVASVHPIAAAVVAGIQSAGSMQDGRSVFTDAADLVNAAIVNLDDFVASAFDAVASIIAAVPVALVDGLPGIIQAIAEGVPTVITALVQAVPDVVVALAQALPAMLPDLVQLFAVALIGAVPLIVVGLVQAFTDPAFYEAIAEGFARAIERMVDGFADLFSTGSTTQAGGGFQLFAPSDTPGRAVPMGSIGTITISPGDLWSDFMKAIGIETGAQGRA